MQAPCKGCKDRKRGCHSICEKYIAFDRHRKALCEQKYKEALSYKDVRRRKMK